MNYSKKQNFGVSVSHGYQSDLTREDWLAWRIGGIGGSDAGIALGCNPYKSALDLYVEKKRGLSDFTGNAATYWGNVLEDQVIEETSRLNPKLCGVLTDLPLMSHPDRPWQLATTDKGILEGARGIGGIEAKTALSLWGGKSWQGNKIPPHYRAQCLHYMAVTGANFWILGALTEGPRFYSFVIERDEDEINHLNEKERLLWEAIQNDDLDYLIDGSRKCADALLKLYPQAEEADPVIITDANAVAAVREYIARRGLEKAAKEDKIESENQLKRILGATECAIIDGCRVQWKQTKTGRRFTVKEG